MNNEIIQKAKEAGKGNWWNTFGPYLLLYGILMLGAFICIVPVLGFIAYFYCALLLTIGFNAYCLKLLHGERKLSTMFSGFNSANIGRWTIFTLWFALFLGVYFAIYFGLSLIPKVGIYLALLFEIPYLVICFGISQCTYILIDRPDLKPLDTFKESWRIMKGHKWRYCWLSVRIVGLPLILILIGYPLMLMVAVFDKVVLQIIFFLIGLPFILAGIIWIICIFGRVAMFPVVFYEAIKGEKTPIGPAEEEVPSDGDPVVL